jgi:surface antigen
MKTIALVLALTVTVGACQTNKQNTGTLLGGAIGGLLGSQVGSGTGQMAAVGLGVLLGGLAGQSVGKSLDDLDRMKIQQTSQHTLETSKDGQSASWRNPNSGNHGTVTPLRTYQQAGAYCREFQQTVTVGGKQESAYGTACRQPDGSWRIKS